jgi:hypothetical protein
LDAAHCSFKRDTLLRYLLDELHSYEEDYSGALCPVQDESHISLLGEHRLVGPASTEEVRMLHGSISSEFKVVQNDLGAMKLAVNKLMATLTDLTQNNLFIASHRQALPQQAIVQPIANINQPPPSLLTRTLVPISVPPQSLPLHPTRPLSVGCSDTNVTSRQLPQSNLLIPDIPLLHPDGTRSPRSDSWREIVEHWENGDPSRGLHTALKDWPVDWLRGPNKLFAMKHHHRAVIAKEFLYVYVLEQKTHPRKSLIFTGPW